VLASAALNLAARIAIPVILLNGVSGVASAQNATWNGPGADWNTPANWNPMTIPGSNGIATFGGALPTSISMAGVSVGTLQFNAPNYIFDVPGNSTINGQGVIGLANAATFNVVSTVGATPAIDFNGTSSAGTAQIILGQVVDTAGGFNAGFDSSPAPGFCRYRRPVLQSQCFGADRFDEVPGLASKGTLRTMVH
jgi:hypothetical protein